MVEWFIGGLGGLFGLVGSAAGEVAGWAWDKVTTGIYSWLASGLALLIEWVWSVLDSATSPRLTANWFANDLAVQVGVLALAVTVAMMLTSAVQAALAGRPEQITDAVKEGARSIVAAALTVTVLDVLLRIVDEASAFVWASGRADLVTMLEGIVAIAALTGPMSQTFIGPLCLMVGFIGLIGLVVALMMRSALIYLVAALAPLVFATNVLPLFRGAARKLVHLAVALVVSKLAIVITLVVAVKLLAHPTDGIAGTGAVNDGAAAVGTLLVGFIAFVVAAVTPVVLYRLMPTVEGAVAGAGVAGGWGRSATTAAHTALMVKSFGASAGASAATRAVGSQGGATGGSGPRGGIAGLTGHQAGSTGTTPQPSAEGGGVGGSAGGASGGRHGAPRGASRTGTNPPVPTPSRGTSRTASSEGEDDER